MNRANKSFEKVHIVNIESFVHQSLQPRQRIQHIDLFRFNPVMLLQSLDSMLFQLHHFNNRIVIINEKMQQRSYNDIVGAACVGVAVDAEVGVKRNHRVVDDPTE